MYIGDNAFEGCTGLTK